MKDLAWLLAQHDRLVTLRREFHAHPEIAFEEEWTADRLSGLLSGLGCRISRRIGGTGFVATLPGGDGPAVALRTDMDALPQDEATGLAYASTRPGRMHACGHDGHMVLLLATAELLAGGPALPGPVHFICQPAEETGRGAEAMIADGLFDEIAPALAFGYHNWPGLPLGVVSGREGPIMAAYRKLGYHIEGRGGHAAMPQHCSPLYAAMARLILLTGERIAAELPATAFAFTQNHGSVAANIIPASLTLSGSFRFLVPDEGRLVQGILADCATRVAAEFGTRVTPFSERVFDVTANHGAAVDAVRRIEGPLSWREAAAPSMVSEDFGSMIRDRRGCYVWLGAGEDRPALHTTSFDFHDALLLTAPAHLAAVLRSASMSEASKA